MSAADSYVLGCQNAAALLESQGKRVLANQIRGLIRSYGASRTANSQLHADNRKLRARLTPIARARAKEATTPPPAELSRLLEPVAAGPAAHAWCDQCQRRVSDEEGRSCERRFCGMKPARLETMDEAA